VIPSLIYVQRASASSPGMLAGVPVNEEKGIELAYYKTYMPPRYLIAQPKPGSWPVKLDDFGSNYSELENLVVQFCSESQSGEFFLVAPSTALPLEDLRKYAQFELRKKFWPHFSTEDPPKQLGGFLLGTLHLYHLTNCSTDVQS
jgi:hypothetical protein